MVEAAPSADSQSPKPQSQVALANDGRASTNSLMRLRSKCATVTISLTSSGGCGGDTSLIGKLGLPLSWISKPRSRAGSPVDLIGKIAEASFNRYRRE